VDLSAHCCERFNSDVDFVGNLRGKRLPAPIEITLYRVLQEAMTNIAKHANAERISVALEADPGGLRLVVMMGRALTTRPRARPEGRQADLVCSAFANVWLRSVVR
jgi:two-component system, chemotaxis family, sensor kinase Cph1